MEQNLIGYLLNALDEETHQHVEDYLAVTPAARLHLDLLRGSLEPLALDAEPPEPPKNLVVSTLARVAEHACGDLPKAPAPPVARTLAMPMAFLGRIDVLAAACLVIAVLGVGAVWLYQVNILHGRTLCQEDLRRLYAGLDAYRSQHDDKFPNVDRVAKAPRNVAGLVVPMLLAQGYLLPKFKFHCPGGDKVVEPIKFDDAMKMSLDDFNRQAEHFTPCVGYSLGYRDSNDKPRGPNYKPADQSNAYVALMADRPPRDSLVSNSLNHGGAGQNVLYTDGHFEFKSKRNAGFKGDDIYSNKKGNMASGADPYDSVIGHGWSKP